MPRKLSVLLVPLISALAICAACETRKQQTRQAFAFGTIVTITATAGQEQLSSAMLDLDSRYRVLDVDWYPWPKSDSGQTGKLFEINRLIADGLPAEVDPRLADLIRRASDIESLSGGRFSAVTGSLTELWGLVDPLETPDSLPDSSRLAALVKTGVSSEHLRWQDNILSSRSRDIVLDLGGIAKGALLVISAEILLANGIHDAIVDIGGDVLVMGEVNNRLARVGIRSPVKDGVLGWLEANPGEAIVTSGNYERFFELNGRRYSHIIDPRSGHPVAHTSSVTVVNHDPVLADAAATALVVGGMDEFDEICESMGILDAMIIDSTGDLRLTPAMEKRVNWSH